MAKYRILTLDGGGVRGILTARLLERLHAQLPDFLEKVDLFAGTSTGSILAVGLAKGLTPADLVALYQEQSRTIFDASLLSDIGDLWGLEGAKYSTQNRYAGIEPSIGNVTLDDLLPKHVLVVSYQLDSQNPTCPSPGPRTWKAKIFHNYQGDESDGHNKAIDVIMRSSAAPTYFPLYQGFVDGGVVANNPSMCALAQAVNEKTGNQDIHDLVLLSIGTGGRPEYLAERDGDWGLRQWGFNLLDLIFDSGIGLADYQCRQLIGDCYHRLDVDLNRSIGLDAVDQLDILLQAADDWDLTPVLEWAQAHW